MRIVHITNFYGSRSATQVDLLNKVAVAHHAAGHEFIAIVPGYQLATIETNNGKVINLPSIRVPFARGRRVFLNQRLLKNILIALDPDEIEVIDQRYLSRIKTWAINRNVRVRTENMPIDFLELKNKFQINTYEMETKIRNGLRQYSIPA
jgi:alpha-1,6-mannosyltransferase